MHDVIVVGAGFAGAVSANLLATKHKKRVLLIEQRDHIGGNCYDYRDQNNILLHKYGPHLFHTSNQKVWDYLSQFSEWTPYEHKVLAHIDGKNVSIPFNFTTIRSLFAPTKAEELIELLLKNYTLNSKVPILELKKNPNTQLQELAEFIYAKVFVGYTAKQWGLAPEELDSAVTARVPVFIGEDDRYFNDTYQALPKEGYTKLFENLLDHPNIEVKLSTPFVFDQTDKRDIIYTGKIDALFDYCYGELPYRSLDMRFETYNTPYFQKVTTVNYPNDYNFTRITEFKHMYDYTSTSTTILKEFPQAHIRDKNTPYYPIFTSQNQLNYEQYVAHAKTFKNLMLLGRLAEYKYYDMDDVVQRVLDVL
ncbi:MAG: UDP-galactopyranose mutase [Sulfurimonadaceae bacterium]